MTRRAATVAIVAGFVERLVRELAAFGTDADTGVWRPVYTPEWVEAADRFAAWCAEAGLDVHRDAVGNIWGRLAGTNRDPRSSRAPTSTRNARAGVTTARSAPSRRWSR